MISRRTFLEHATTLAAGLSLKKTAFARSVTTPALDPNTLRPWVDPLPFPEIARSTGSRPDPENPSQNLPFYRMAMRELHYKVHRDLPPTRVWGFNNSSPGPIFETRSGQGLLVEWANELPLQHFLPIDHTIHGAESDKPDVRSVIHLHGGKTPPASDGYPEDWYVPGQSRIYHYPNRQDAALLFYHDHTMGINRLNIYAGLQGLFLIRDRSKTPSISPKGSTKFRCCSTTASSSPMASCNIPSHPTPNHPGFPRSTATPCWSMECSPPTSMSNRAPTASA